MLTAETQRTWSDAEEEKGGNMKSYLSLLYLYEFFS
jgi:hypothetical protein